MIQAGGDVPDVRHMCDLFEMKGLLSKKFCIQGFCKNSHWQENVEHQDNIMGAVEEAWNLTTKK